MRYFVCCAMCIACASRSATATAPETITYRDIPIDWETPSLAGRVPGRSKETKSIRAYEPSAPTFSESSGESSWGRPPARYRAVASGKETPRASSISLAPSGSKEAKSIRAYDPIARTFSQRSGKLTCGRPAASKTDPEAFALVEPLRNEFKKCYLAQSRQDPGAACISLTLGSDGHVTLVEIESQSLSYGLENCILLNGSRASIPHPVALPRPVTLRIVFVPCD